MGLLAALAAFASRPVLLDLAFDFGAGSDDGLVMPHGAFRVIRFIATSLVSDGKWSYGVGRVGADVCDGSNSDGGSDASVGSGDVDGSSFRRFSAIARLRNIFPSVQHVFCPYPLGVLVLLLFFHIFLSIVLYRCSHLLLISQYSLHLQFLHLVLN